MCLGLVPVAINSKVLEIPFLILPQCFPLERSGEVEDSTMVFDQVCVGLPTQHKPFGIAIDLLEEEFWEVPPQRYNRVPIVLPRHKIHDLQ